MVGVFLTFSDRRHVQIPAARVLVVVRGLPPEPQGLGAAASIGNGGGRARTAYICKLASATDTARLARVCNSNPSPG